MRNQLASIIRTLVPVIVGLILAGLAKAGLDLPASFTGDLQFILEVVVIGGYYSAVRLLEERYPAVGWHLGLPAAPQYARLENVGPAHEGGSDPGDGPPDREDIQPS